MFQILCQEEVERLEHLRPVYYRLSLLVPLLLPNLSGAFIDENGRYTGEVYEKLLSSDQHRHRKPAHVNEHGEEGKNFDIDDNGMPFIWCEQLNTTCKHTSYNDCTRNVKCFPERRTHKLGCMAVFVYNTSEVAHSNGSMPTSSAMLKGCWSQDESELRECEETDECVASTRKTGVEWRAAKFCCCRTHYCNHNLTFYSDIMPQAHGYEEEDKKLVIFNNVHWLSSVLLSTDFFAVSAILLLLIFFLFTSCVAIWYVRKRRFRHTKSCIKLDHCQTDDAHSESNMEITNEGTALLGAKAYEMKQAALHNMKATQLLSTGHFSELFRAEVGEASVVIRTYHKNESDCWLNEQEIYSVKALRKHDNIVSFLAAFRNQGQFWFVTRYYPMGSVNDFLELNTPNLAESTRVLYTMLSGLAFLHEEFMVDGELKPCIVHRDLKSKNVLIKADLTACIGDFSLSVRCENGRMANEENQSQVGTRRYMSPEVLEGATEFTGFAFQQIDVYAAALIVWEVLSRTVLPEFPDEVIPEYQLPYEREIGKTPSLGRMRELVVIQQHRPQSRDSLFTNVLTNRMIKTMKDMWDSEPDGRITSSCARDRMSFFLEVALGKAALTGSTRSCDEVVPSASSSLRSFECADRTDASYCCPSATGTTIPVEQLNNTYATSTTSAHYPPSNVNPK